MFWRLVSTLGILFWAVMTGLLVRDTYFPEESRFAEVPPGMVLDMFLTHRGSTSSMLLFRDDAKIGCANISVTADSVPPGQPRLYRLRGSGLIEGMVLGRPGSSLSWLLESELGEDSQWKRLQFQSRLTPADGARGEDDGLLTMLSWKAGDALPHVELREGGRKILDSSMVATLLQGRQLPLAGLIEKGSAAGNATAGIAQLTAREGLMRLAGKRRKCYILTVQLAGTYQIKALFTEAGELASIDLPQGYRLLDPGINDLAPVTEP